MRTRLMLGAVLLAAIALLAVPVIVLADGSSNKSESPDNARAARTSPAAEQLRVERRESFRHTGCSKRTRLSDV